MKRKRVQGYAGMTVPELKAELRVRGLPVGGKKACLIQRLEDDDNAPCDAGPTALDVPVADSTRLENLLQQKKQQVVARDAMRGRVDLEMQSIMDNGIRVNPFLQQLHSTNPPALPPALPPMASQPEMPAPMETDATEAGRGVVEGDGAGAAMRGPERGVPPPADAAETSGTARTATAVFPAWAGVRNFTAWRFLAPGHVHIDETMTLGEESRGACTQAFRGLPSEAVWWLRARDGACTATAAADKRTLRLYHSMGFSVVSADYDGRVADAGTVIMRADKRDFGFARRHDRAQGQTLRCVTYALRDIPLSAVDSMTQALTDRQANYRGDRRAAADSIAADPHIRGGMDVRVTVLYEGAGMDGKGGLR